MLTILASYAQEESLSVSENQKWRVRKNFEEGKPWNSTMLGYRYSDGKLIIVPEEAKVVKRIYELFISGCGVQSIVNQLNADGCTTFNNIGKNACASKQIPETTLEKLTENIDMSTVTGITADDGNRFIFHFKDGGFVEKRWRDRSRSESWTDEMRQRAAEQTKARYQICRKEM